MQAVSNLPISAWLPPADLNGEKTAAGCRGKPGAGLTILVANIIIMFVLQVMTRKQ